jgi:hypothetical protein
MRDMRLATCVIRCVTGSTHAICALCDLKSSGLQRVCSQSRASQNSGPMKAEDLTSPSVLRKVTEKGVL